MCDCNLTLCSCNGFPQEFPAIPEGQTITSVEVNGDNTITLTLSNGDTITSTNSITITENPRAYVLAFNNTVSSSKTLTVPPNTLTQNGDSINLSIRGTIDITVGANPVLLNVNGTSFNIIADPSIFNFLNYLSLDIKIIRETSTKLVFYMSFRIITSYNNQPLTSQESIFEYNSFSSSANTVIYVGQADNILGDDAKFRLLHANIIKQL